MIDREFEIKDLWWIFDISEYDFTMASIKVQKDIMNQLGYKLKYMYESGDVSADFVESAYEMAKFYAMQNNIFN